MAKSKQQPTHVQIPDEWAHKDLDINSRFILGVIHRLQESGKRYHMKRETFCELYKMDPSMYKRRLAFLLEQELIIITRAFAKGTKEYIIDYNELEFFLKNGKKKVVKKPSPGHSDPTKKDSLGHSDPQPGHSDPSALVIVTHNPGHSDPSTQVIVTHDPGHSGPSLLPDYNQIRDLPDNNTILFTKLNTKPENSFDDIDDEWLNKQDLSPLNYNRPNHVISKEEITNEDILELLNDIDL